jgi:phosphatidylserine/phosphatidylglycerophosphate/cardiolipin synthase-like enzyme
MTLSLYVCDASKPIAKAMLEAHQVGDKIDAIVAQSRRTANYNSATFLANSRVPTVIDAVHAIAHNMIIIFYDQKAITGLLNLTKTTTEKNVENILIIKSPKLGKLYIENLNHHKEHSEPDEPRDYPEPCLIPNFM